MTGTCRWTIALVLASLAVAAPAHADTIVVNSSEDEFGTGPKCTLREAVEAANLNSSFGGCQNSGTQPDLIKVDYFQRGIAGAAEDLNATGDLDVTGDVTVTVSNDYDDTVRGLIQDIAGKAKDRFFDVHPGATLTLQNLHIQFAHLDPATAGGGSEIRVAAGAALIVSDVDLGISSGAPAIDNAGNALLSRVSIGGVQGAIRNTGLLRADRLVVDYSSMAPAIDNSGIAALENATITGGFSLPNPDPAKNYSGGVINRPGGTLALENSILAANTRSELPWPPTGALISAKPDDCDGEIVSRGYNVVQAPECSIAPGPGDQLGVDPMLDPQGHDALTPKPLPGSPVIDAGSPEPAADATGPCSPVDFEGRLLNGRCDIGAYEVPAIVTIPRPVSCHGDTVNHPELGGGTGPIQVPLTRSTVLLLHDGNDTVNGSPFDDKVCAAGGRDHLAGAGGPDELFGETGNDRVGGGAGKDKLSGGPGRDILRGGPGPDTLVGGPGRDRLIGGPGRDRCFQGSRGRFTPC